MLSDVAITMVHMGLGTSTESMPSPSSRCPTCGDKSEAHCANVILEEMNVEFRPEGVKFLEMTEVIVRNHRLVRSRFHHGYEAPVDSIAHAVAVKMMVHRVTSATLLGRLVFSILREHTDVQRRRAASKGRKPPPKTAVRTKLVRKQLRLDAVAVPSFHECKASFKHVRNIVNAMAEHKRELLYIPTMHSKPKKKLP